MKNGISRIRSVGVGVLAALTATVGLIPLLTGPADAASNVTSRRFPGTNRFDTARLVAAAIGSSPTVVIARGDLYPDALAGAYVAGINNAAILLTRSDAVPAETSAAMTALGATKAIIMGGTTAVSTAVENTLRARPGTTVERISGPTRFETAVAAASQGGGTPIGVLDTFKTAIVASGVNFPDAISGSPIAYAAKFPILLTAPTSLTAVTRNAITSLGIKQVLLLGGPDAVSTTVENELKTTMGLAVSRLAGANRSGTSAEVTKFAISKLGFTNRRVGLARGDDFADALSYAGLAGRSRAATAPAAGAAAAAIDNGPNGVILSTSFNVVGEEALAFARSIQPTATELEVLGGPDAETPANEAAFLEALKTAAPAPGAAAFTFSSTSPGTGASITGNITGNNVGAVTASGCGLNNAAVRQGPGAFTLGPFPGTAQSCTVTFTITPANGVGAPQTVTQAFTVGGPTSGPVALASTTGQQGSSQSGTVTNPSTVQSLTVSGCGLGNTNLPINATGGFTFNVPNSTAAGTCNLVFVVQRTNGTSETQTVPFTVTASPATTTAAPDLQSAAVLPGDVVQFNFDQQPTGVIPPGGFHLYNASGTQFTGTTTTIVGNAVNVQFPVGTVAGATVATVDQNTVQAPSGAGNPVCAAPLNSTTQTAGRTSAPDLVSVTNFQTFAEGPPGNVNLVADFTFDQAVATVGPIFGQGAAPTMGGGVNSPAGNFELILADNTIRTGLAAPTGTSTNNVNGGNAGVVVVSSDLKTVRVNFGPIGTTPISQIVRGAVEAATVTSTTGTPNIIETVPVSNGATPNITVSSDLLSAAVTGANTVTYTFDQAVNPAIGAPPGLNAAGFLIYDAGANVAAATSVVRSNTDDKVVIATFAAAPAPPTPTVGSAVGAIVNDAAATTTIITSGSPPAIEEVSVALQNVTSQAGRTALPDLVSVQIIKDSLGNPQTVYTFDGPLPTIPGVYTAPVGSTPGQVLGAGIGAFRLYDNQATPFVPGGTGRISTDRTQVVFGVDTVTPGGPYAGFTLSQAAAAVMGGVDGTANAAAAPAPPAPLVNTNQDFPEGCAPATKSGF